MSQEEILKRELYFLIYKFLENSPLQESFDVIRKELISKSLLPPQYDWTNGREISTTDENTLQQVLAQNRHITADFLFRSLKQCHQALNEISPPPIQAVISFLSGGRFSLTRNIPKKSLIQQTEDLLIPHQTNPYSLVSLSNHRNHAPVLSSKRFSSAYHPGNICNTLFSRQLCGVKPISHLVSINFYEQYQKYHRILGHLSSVFCVLFDRTGKYLITGADDAIIKIWSTISGRLLASLRGHQGEITDLSVSMENDMLASGSCDKKIRVWNLRSTALITTLKAHENQISGVKFCPLMTTKTRYLVSISQDGSVCFFKYDAITRQFNNQPIRYVERKRRDSQLVSSSFSAGGAFFAVGSTDAVLYVYHLLAPAGPAKILEIEQHTDHVDSLQFSNHSLLKFISGGRDGLAHIWNYEKQKWHNLRIDINERLSDQPETNDETNKKGGIRVCMVAWTIDDRYVITSLTDNSIKVWLAHNAKLKHILYGHEDEVYIIEPHPIDGRIILTGGHDGAVMIWDVVTGTNIKTFYNAIDGQGSGSLFDAKWNPDGTMFAVTDSYGHLLLFGLGKHNPYEKLPDQLFFHTDYRPLVRDANDFVIDEQMQVAPHLMPPPFLVDIDGNPYPPNLQRLVPGRENCVDSQLIPYVDNYQVPFQDQERQRQTIDDLIEQLQRNVDLANNNGTNNNNNNNNDQQQENELLNNMDGNQNAFQQHQQQARNAPRDMGQRRNGDVEGVRNSANFVSADGGQMGIFVKNPLIAPFDQHEIEVIEARQNALTKEEEEYYNNERRKRPNNQEMIAIEESGLKAKPFTRRQKRINQQRRGVRCSVRSLRSMNDNERDLEEDIDDENDKDFTGASEDESTEEDEQTSDSDWNQTAASAVASSSFVSGRKRKRRRTDGGSSDDDDDDNEENQQSVAIADTNDLMNQPSSSSWQETSTSSRPKRSRVEESENRRAERRKRFEQIKLDRYGRRFRQVDTLDERFRPPDWFTNSKPKRTPYFPQIGDKVVYFRQGHQNYIDAIRRTKCYNINLATKPFKLRGSEADEIFAKIIGIQYSVRPPRLVTLKMVVIDPQAEANYNDEPSTSAGSFSSPNNSQQFSVRYHDIDHVCDFIILKQLYDVSIARVWRVNDVFRSVCDDKWWVGRIHSIRYMEENSYFQSVEVIWNNNERELLSPWDLEPMANGETAMAENGDGTPVTDEERLSFSMIDETEWPLEHRQRDRERLINGLIRIMQFSHAEEFSVPVDLNQHPTYAMTVPYPMDLSTIKARLENNFYRRMEAVKFDAKFIESNACLYNVPESEIVRKAKIIAECCLKFFDDDQCTDPQEIYNEVSNCYSVEANRAALNSSAGSSSHTLVPSELGMMDRPRRSTRRVRVQFSDSDEDEPPTTVQPASSQRSSVRFYHRHRANIAEERHRQDEPIKSWKQLCRELIDYIFELQDSEPFRAPVDPILYPNYSHVIDTPMDLTTVKEQLLADVYDSPADFCKDMRLIFTNSKTYNTNKKSRIYSMTVRLSALFEEKMRKVISDLKWAKKMLKRGERGGVSASGSSIRNRGGRGRIKSPSTSADEQRPEQMNQNHRSNRHPRRMVNSCPTLSNTNLNRHLASSSNNQRSSHRIANNSCYYQSSSHKNNGDKYKLRHRKKTNRNYKEESDEDDVLTKSTTSGQDSDDDDDQELSPTNSANAISDAQYHLRSKRSMKIFEDDSEEEEEAFNEDDDDSDKTDLNDEKTDVGESDDEEEEEEEEDDDDDEEEEAEDEKIDDDEEENGNDSDATQVYQEDDNKENSTKGRPVRAAARKRVNYDENDSDENEVLETIRERNVNVRTIRRNSFASINESSQESMSSTRSVSSGMNADAEDPVGRLDESGCGVEAGLRRSQRKIRPKRRYSSEDSDREFHHHHHHHRKTQRSIRNYNNPDYDNSDLYSAVKTRHRSASTSHHNRHRGSSSRHTPRINYNEDDVCDQLYEAAAYSTTDRRGNSGNNVFSNGNRAALIGR